VRRNFVYSLAFAFVGFAVLFGAEWLIEWHRLGEPSLSDMTWANNNNAKLVDILSPMARAYNNVLAMLVGMIGLAIPLTANMHTPKLIDVFLRDKINRVVLSFMALGAAHVLFVDWIIGPKFAPMWAMRIAVYTAIIGWALLIPYFFYVIRFLDPSNVIHRLKDEAQRGLRDVRGGKLDPGEAQDLTAQRVREIGTIALKSLDRGDRGVAREGVWALKRLLDRYAKEKPNMPAPWFVVDRADFIGLSSEALAMLCADHTWFEMKCMHQMFLAFQAALAKTPDAVSAISDATRVVAEHSTERGDVPVTRMAIRYFNNYLRESIKRKDVHAVYDVLYQYRLLAKFLAEHHRGDRLREIVRHFQYYAEMARMNGLAFAPQLAVFDLGYVVRHAYDAQEPSAGELLDETLAMPHRRGDELLRMAVKAKLMLGGYLVEKDLQLEASRVRDNLRDVAPAVVASATDEMLAAEESFFEVTDHQVNLEYVPPERREPLRRFAGSLAA
jgi:hypothetical protein